MEMTTTSFERWVLAMLLCTGIAIYINAIDGPTFFHDKTAQTYYQS